MRQPTSVYARSAAHNISRFAAKVQNRINRLQSRKTAAVPDGRRATRSQVSLEALEAALAELGLTRGDSVMVHSGISQLGKVAGGPKGIFELLARATGTDGHVLYPVFPFDNLMYEYLRHGPTFDVRTAASKMGALTEYALKAADGMRSVHPTHSVIAFGPRRAEFVAEHHLCPAPFTDQSPFARIVDVKGKILLLGVGLNSTTGFHRIEDRLGDAFPVKVYHRDGFSIECVDSAGTPVRVSTRAHDPFISRIRDCDLLRPAFLREGVLREVKVGDGIVSLIDAAGMDQLLESEWRRNRLTIYGRIWG